MGVFKCLDHPTFALEPITTRLVATFSNPLVDGVLVAMNAITAATAIASAGRPSTLKRAKSRRASDNDVGSSEHRGA